MTRQIRFKEAAWREWILPSGEMKRRILPPAAGLTHGARANRDHRRDQQFPGEADGSRDALELIVIAADRLRSRALP